MNIAHRLQRSGQEAFASLDRSGPHLSQRLGQEAAASLNRLKPHFIFHSILPTNTYHPILIPRPLSLSAVLYPYSSSFILILRPSSLSLILYPYLLSFILIPRPLSLSLLLYPYPFLIPRPSSLPILILVPNLFKKKKKTKKSIEP